MARIRHVCSTCEHWDRCNVKKTASDTRLYARCLITIYSRWSDDKCKLWKKWQEKTNH